MSRDLFTNSYTARPAPTRSKWMIGTSILAHAGVVCALLIIPILSAADAFVLRANDRLAFPVPVVMTPPPSSPPRPANPSSAPPQATVEVVPLAPPDHPVTEVARVTGPPASELLIGDRFVPGPHIPGAPPGTDRRLVDAPPPVVLQPLRAGGDIKAPERTFYLAPEYPGVARAAKVEGRAVSYTHLTLPTILRV